MSSRKQQQTTTATAKATPQPRGFARLAPEQRQEMARLGAYTRAAQNSGREMTAAARLALADSWGRKADPDGVLPPAERARRAEALRQAHYARMRLARWGKQPQKKAS